MIRKKTYGNLSRSENSWIISDLEPHVALRLKQLFPKLPRESAGPFIVMDQLDTAADILWFCSRYEFAASNSDKRYLKRQANKFFKKQAATESILLPDYIPHQRAGLLPGQAFRQYQLIALDYIDRVKSLLIIDAMGLGKTYEGLGIALLSDALPLVVICEPHNQEQWFEKATSFIDIHVHKVTGNTPYSLPPAGIYIAKYNQMAPWIDTLTQGWIKSLVFDEVQQLRRGTESAKGRAAKQICNVVPIIAGLTGTLIYNYGIEAWNIVDMFRPGLLGTKEEFLREWCSVGDERGVVKDPEALGTYLQEAQIVLRRTREDAGQESKQTEPHIEWVAPDVHAVSDAADLAQQLAIKTLTADFSEAGQAARDFDLKMREMTGIAKARAVAAYVRMIIESGTPVLLFGWHHEVYRIWAEELADLNPLFYTGKQTQSQKDRNKKAFIAGESDLLIMSLRSGAGVDGLHKRCSTAVIGEFDWSPKVHDQGIARLDRDDQMYMVWVVYVATRFGSDPEMIDMLGLKESQSHGIMDPGKDVIQRQTDTNRLKNMAKAYLKARGVQIPNRSKSTQNPDTNEELAALI